MNQFLALVCILREDHFDKQGLIDYNFNCFREAIQEVFDSKMNHGNHHQLPHVIGNPGPSSGSPSSPPSTSTGFVNNNQGIIKDGRSPYYHTVGSAHSNGYGGEEISQVYKN